MAVCIRNGRTSSAAAGRPSRPQLAPAASACYLDALPLRFSSMRATKPFEGSIALGLGENLYASPGDHIAYFWESDEDFRRGTKFLEVGIEDGDHAVVFGHEEANERVLDVLRSAGVPVEDLIRRDRLVVVGALPTGEATLQQLGATFGRMLDRGASRFRLLGNIGWGRSGWPSETDLLAFESRVTRAIGDLPCVVVCMYDIASLSGRIMVHGAFETHPLTVCRNVLRENPHHVEIDEYLASLADRRTDG